MPNAKLIFASANPRNWLRLRAALPVSVQCDAVTGTQLLEALRESSALACVIDSSALTPALRAHLRDLKSDPARPALFIMVEHENVGSDVEWADGHSAWELPAMAVWASLRHTITARVVEMLLRMCGHSTDSSAEDSLSKAVFALLTAQAPYGSVEELAAARNTTARKYHKWWHDRYGVESAITLGDLVDWILLLRAVDTKVPLRAWSVAGATTRIGKRRVRRIADRLLHVDLDTIERDPLCVFEGFRATVRFLAAGGDLGR